MTLLTNYNEQSLHFSQLPEYSIECGAGLATRYCKKNFPQAFVIGADINCSMLEQARLADPQGVYIQIPHTNNQIHYPFMPNTFDAVICSFVFHQHKLMHELQLFLVKLLLCYVSEVYC